MLPIATMQGLYLNLFILLAMLHLTSARPQLGHSFQRRATLMVRSDLRTNAARMAFGLPPMPPRSLFNPTRVQARDPAPSVQPPITGYLVARKPDGSTTYIYKNSESSTIGFTNNAAKGMTISFPATGSLFNIAITSGGPYPNLGFAGNFFQGDGSLPLVFTNPTSPNSKALNVGNSGGPPRSESAVWSYSGGKLTVNWVNPDGDSVPGTLWYFPGQNKVAIVQNIPDHGYAITLSVA